MQKIRDHLSLAQITYLEMIEKLQREGKKCSVTKVASLSGVTHAPVSRFMKLCQEQNLTDEKNQLTDEGKSRLREQKHVLDETRKMVQDLGFSGETEEKAVRNLMEDMEPVLLKRLLERERKRKELVLLCECGNDPGTIPTRAVEELISYGRHAVEFRLMRSRGEGLSMADKGFEHPAYIRKDDDGVRLELRRKKMIGRSGKDGHMMTGQLDTLKYEMQGRMHEAGIQEDTLIIPLEAFQFVREFEKEFAGTLYVTLTCSVGEEHMPENTARLLLWL